MEENKILAEIFDSLEVPLKSKTKMGVRYDRNIMIGFINKNFVSKKEIMGLLKESDGDVGFILFSLKNGGYKKLKSYKLQELK